MRIVKEYLIPVILLCIFALLMLSTDYMKEPKGRDDDVIQKVKDIEIQMARGEWPGCELSYEELIKAWDHVLFRIQFSIDKDVAFALEDQLALLKGAIKAKSSELVTVYCEAIRVVWNSLSE